MDAILYFDTEDVISPPQVGCDDIVRWIADLLTANNLRGSFHIIGDKARLLEARGRSDVINAIKRHDVSSHYNTGSTHPMTVERVASAQWHQGVDIALQFEKPCFDDVQRIFGKCAALTRHGSSYAPQIVRAAGLCNKMFHGLPFTLPNQHIFWFCGTLCTTQLGLIRTKADQPSVGKFEEDNFANDPHFNNQLAQFTELMNEVTPTLPFAAMFGCHPLRLVVSRFCDNYVGGKNVSPLRPPPVRPITEQLHVKRNFERYIQAIAKIPNLHVIGMDGLAKKYGGRRAQISAQVLHDYCHVVLTSHDVPLHDRFSPAELLVALAESILIENQTGSLPSHLTRHNVIGPVTDLPPSLPDTTLSRAALLTLAKALHRESLAHSELPAQIQIETHAVAPADMLGLFAQLYLDMQSHKQQQTYTIADRLPWPAIANTVDADVKSLGKWRIFGPSMTFDHIARFTQLQCWSLVPAHAD